MPLRPELKTPVHNIQVIDLARTLAILPVLALHSTPWLLDPQNDLPEVWDHLQRNGAFGVSIFFMISGFLITRILDRAPGGAFKANWGKFYAHRVGRIIPLFVFDILLGLFFWIFLKNSSLLFACCFHLPAHPGDVTFWIPLLFFAFNWARAYWSLNRWGDISLHWGVLWSLAVEEQFYLFYPILLNFLKRPRNLFFFFGALLAVGFGWRWFVLQQPMDNGLDWKWGSFGYFDQIGLGIGLYFAQKKWGSGLRARPGWSFSIAFIGLAGFAVVFWMASSARLFDSFYAPWSAAAALALSLLGALNISWLESKFFWIFSLPGKYSYGNYLFHTTVLYFLSPRLMGGNIYLSFPIFAATSTAVAALSFHFFETPANRWIRTKFHAA